MTANYSSPWPPGNEANAESVDDDEIVRFNVGGCSYRFRTKTIKRRLTDSLLRSFVQADSAERARMSDGYLKVAKQSEEYYFERSARLFDSIYRFYTTGHLHKPLDVCTKEFQAELEFWLIPQNLLADCCLPKEKGKKSQLTNGTVVLKGFGDVAGKVGLRRRMHAFFDGDGTLGSKIFMVISSLVVLISICGLVIGSMREFEIQVDKTAEKPSELKAIMLDDDTSANATNSSLVWEPLPVFGYIEIGCIIWFTLEYLLRLSAAPRRCRFVYQAINIIDLIAILPFYLVLVLDLCGVDFASLKKVKGALLVVRVLRVLRVVRILKLSRYSTGMRTFGQTLRRSSGQLMMTAMVLASGIVFFATLLYFVEKDEPNTPFTSIPASFWWAIVTMTTVGYGDYVPATIAGKLVAGFAIICGVLVLALPITVLVDNFMKVSGSVIKRPKMPNDIITATIRHPSQPINAMDLDDLKETCRYA